MPSVDEHQTKAEQNESFARSLTSTPFLDWVVVGCYYSALHYVDAYLIFRHGIHPKRHTSSSYEYEEGRNKYVRNHLNALWTDYRFLQMRSIEARYDCVGFTIDKIDSQIFPRLVNIKDTITRSIRQST